MCILLCTTGEQYDNLPCYLPTIRAQVLSTGGKGSRNDSVYTKSNSWTVYAANSQTYWSEHSSNSQPVDREWLWVDTAAVRQLSSSFPLCCWPEDNCRRTCEEGQQRLSTASWCSSCIGSGSTERHRWVPHQHVWRIDHRPIVHDTCNQTHTPPHLPLYTVS